MEQARLEKGGDNNPVAFLKKNKRVVKALADEGRLSPLQMVICRELGILERGEGE